MSRLYSVWICHCEYFLYCCCRSFQRQSFVTVPHRDEAKMKHSWSLWPTGNTRLTCNLHIRSLINLQEILETSVLFSFMEVKFGAWRKYCHHWGHSDIVQIKVNDSLNNWIILSVGLRGTFPGLLEILVITSDWICWQLLLIRRLRSCMLEKQASDSCVWWLSVVTELFGFAVLVFYKKEDVWTFYEDLRRNLDQQADSQRSFFGPFILEVINLLCLLQRWKQEKTRFYECSVVVSTMVRSYSVHFISRTFC